MTETRAAILAEIETLLARYMTHGSEWENTHTMVTGFVFKVAGRVFDDDGETHRLQSWAALQDADSFATLGLAVALHGDVAAWYDECTSESYGETEDD